MNFFDLGLTHFDLFVIISMFAAVAELADAPDLGSGVNDVGVQVPSAAPLRVFL